MALTSNVEKDVPESIRGVVFINILCIVDNPPVYSEVLQDRGSISTIRVEPIASLVVRRKR